MSVRDSKMSTQLSREGVEPIRTRKTLKIQIFKLWWFHGYRIHDFSTPKTSITKRLKEVKIARYVGNKFQNVDATLKERCRTYLHKNNRSTVFSSSSQINSPFKKPFSRSLGWRLQFNTATTLLSRLRCWHMVHIFILRGRNSSIDWPHVLAFLALRLADVVRLGLVLREVVEAALGAVLLGVVAVQCDFVTWTTQKISQSVALFGVKILPNRAVA